MSRQGDIVRFGTFEFDLTRDQLWRAGRHVRMAPQPARLLHLLIIRAGDVVTRDEIRKCLWPEGTWVNFDQGINHSVRTLRSALGDDAATARFIETLPRVGYRFFGGIERFPSETGDEALTESDAVPADQSPAPALRATFSHRRLRIGLAVGVLSVFVLTLSMGIARLTRGSGEAQGPFRHIRLDQLTRSGTVWSAALSPDGTYLAYAMWEPGEHVLRLRSIGIGSDIRIVDSQRTPITAISFTTEGDQVYFVRRESFGPGYSSLYRVSILGGTVTRVLSDVDSGVAFSPDGGRFVFVRDDPIRNRTLLIAARRDGSGETPVTELVGPDRILPQTPAWSPDGRHLAIGVWRPTLALVEIALVDPEDGRMNVVGTSPWSGLRGFDWLPDGSGLLVAGRPPGAADRNQLWRLDYPAGDITPVSNDIASYRGISVAGTRVATLQTDRWTSLGSVAPQRDEPSRQWSSGESEPLSRLVAVRRGPDGGAVFTASHEGRLVLWLMHGAGRSPQPIVHASAPDVRQFSVTPDGETIVYSASGSDGSPHLWSVSARGGEPVQLTNGGGETAPSVCSDGTVFFRRYDAIGIWRLDRVGAAPRRISDLRAVGKGPVGSPDCKLVALGALLPAGDRLARTLIVVEAEGGEPIRQVSWEVGDQLRWSPDGRAVQWRGYTDGMAQLWEYRLDVGGQPRPILPFEAGLIYSWDWAVDGETLLYAHGSTSTDAVLISEIR